MKTTTYKFLAAAAVLSVAGFAQAQTLKPIFPLMPPTVSTVPANGDVNPYGVAFVPRTVPADGVLRPGDILVSNFNNSQNLQGTGTTIVRISAGGQQSLFYQSVTPGLTAALGVLANGIVLVGNLATADGTSATVQPGSLIAIDRNGALIGAITSPSFVNGPWGMALHDSGTGVAQVFFSNILSGTVVRMDMQYGPGARAISIANTVTVASGYRHRTDPAALVLGPSGLAYDAAHDVLYVASSADNLIYALAGAGAATSSQGTGTVILNDIVHLHGPLDLVFAPNGHLLVANSDGANVDPNQPSELVEFTTAGQFVGQYSVDANNGGAFGLNIVTLGWGGYQGAAVDDNANILRIWTGSIL